MALRALGPFHPNDGRPGWPWGRAPPFQRRGPFCRTSVSVYPTWRMRVLDVARKVKTLFAPRSRRASVGTRRAHVEFRVGDDSEIEVFAAAVRRLAADVPGLEWLEVNAHTKRVVLGYREAACDADQLIQLVEQAERLAQLSAAAFDEAVEYSADDELGVPSSC
jgi:hypothetical protein